MAKNKLSVVNLILVAATLAGAAQVRAGQEGGNGGGGVVKNGVYMTFYSAGLYVQPSTLGSMRATIPQLDSLIRYISATPLLGDHGRATLLNAIIPTSTRQYYIATPDQLTPVIKQRLLLEFQRVTKVDPKQLALYALTDTAAQTTFILPEFFHLNANDQMSILFHEAYWVMHPDASYNEVVQAEMAFEAALTSPDNPARAVDFVKRIGTVQENFQAEAKIDLADGALNGLVQQDRFGSYIPFSALFKSDLVECVNRQRHKGKSFTKNSSFYKRAILLMNTECFPILKMDMLSLTDAYPRSASLPTLVSSVNSLPQDSYEANELLYTDLTDQDFQNTREYADGFTGFIQHCNLYIQPDASSFETYNNFFTGDANVRCDLYLYDGSYSRPLEVYGTIPLSDK